MDGCLQHCRVDSTTGNIILHTVHICLQCIQIKENSVLYRLLQCTGHYPAGRHSVNSSTVHTAHYPAQQCTAEHSILQESRQSDPVPAVPALAIFAHHSIPRYYRHHRHFHYHCRYHLHEWCTVLKMIDIGVNFWVYWPTQIVYYKEIKRLAGVRVPVERMQLVSKPHEVQKVVYCDPPCGRGIKASLLLFVQYPPFTPTPRKMQARKGAFLWWMCGAGCDRKPSFLFGQCWRTGDKKLWSNANLERRPWEGGQIVQT